MTRINLADYERDATATLGDLARDYYASGARDEHTLRDNGAAFDRSLALGASAVQIGRPALWGLAVDGASGVAHVLDLLRSELDEAMALCGTPTIATIRPDLIA